MPVFPPPTSTSPYAIFEEGHPRLVNKHNVLDYNGVPLYKGDFGELFFAIIERNDIPLLNQYLTKYPRRSWQADISIYDPFLKAAASGSTDALRVMLEHCAATKSKIVDGHGYLLLHEACQYARVDTVCFLLENKPVFRHAHAGIGTIHARDRSGRTSLLAAAESFLSWSNEEHNMSEQVARSEQLMQVLLDMGACASNVTGWPDGTNPDPSVMTGLLWGETFTGTVLSLAMSQASPSLVKRLVDGGASVQSKTMRSFDSHGGAYALADKRLFQGVTPLHIGSFYLNSAGIQMLFEQ